MKSILIIAAFTIAAFSSKAQQVDTTKSISADTGKLQGISPSFPGGEKKLNKFLAKNIRYPSGAFSKHIQGKVLLSVIIEKDGSLTDIKVVKGVASDIDAEAIRVMNLSPKWNPGYQGGRPVRVLYMQPVNFYITDY
jgi:periplasmic protein TonB